VVVWDRVQDPFGRQVSLTNSGGIDTSLRFPGQQADPDTGFAYNYFRDYDPTLGRYVQADPIGLAGGINRYAYVGGNPLIWVDEWGLETIFEYVTGLDDSYRVGALNAVAGFQDALTFGLGNKLRDWTGLNKDVNRCSTLYAVVEWSTAAIGGARLAYAGLAKGVSLLPAVTGAQAAAARNQLKRAFRLNLFRSYRAYSYEQLMSKYGTDAAVKAAAGRTNMSLNIVGAWGLAGAFINDAQCECQ
jgi:RHS repeat-associated protein